MRTFPDAIRFCLSAAFSALAGRRYLSCLWELTYRCTARCGICGYWKNPSNQEDELSLSQIKIGIQRIFEYGCRLVNFTGGEPTIREDLEQIVSCASTLGMWTSVVTNGSLLTRERVRGLRKMGLDNLLVSLDSTSPAAHDAQRGIPGSHAKVAECMHWIKEDFLQGHRTGGIMCVISRQNSGEISDLVRFARKHRVYIVFQPYHSHKTGDQGPVPEIGKHQILQLVRSNGNLAVLNSKSYLRGLEEFQRRSNFLRCHAGQKYFSIDPFGFLHPCVDMPAVGHIFQNDLTVLQSAQALDMVANCRGCWYCFRGEADTSLSLGGCFEKACLGVAVFRHNASIKG
jgi:MoaA/NifB/PqqE/SkfB family radical SAM enzyme